MPDGLFVDLLDDSYDLIVTGLPARQRPVRWSRPRAAAVQSTTSTRRGAGGDLPPRWPRRALV